MGDLRCLTVQQPWAWAIFHGKDVENRRQLLKYRGPLAIHAGGRWSERGAESPLIRRAADAAGHWSHERGAILGVVTLYDVHRAWRTSETEGCCESAWGEHGDRIVHLRLGGAIEFDSPITDVRGMLGLWKPDPDVRDLIGQRTREAA